MLILYMQIRRKLTPGRLWHPKIRILSDFGSLKGGMGDRQQNANRFDGLQVFGVDVNCIRVCKQRMDVFFSCFQPSCVQGRESCTVQFISCTAHLAMYYSPTMVVLETTRLLQCFPQPVPMAILARPRLRTTLLRPDPYHTTRPGPTRHGHIPCFR